MVSSRNAAVNGGYREGMLTYRNELQWVGAGDRKGRWLVGRCYIPGKNHSELGETGRMDGWCGRMVSSRNDPFYEGERKEG